jgi:hypothetical protein
MKKEKNERIIILMLLTDIIILLIQLSIILFIFNIYKQTELIKFKDKCSWLISFCLLILNELFLFMKFHSECNDHYSIKLKRNLLSNILSITLTCVGLIIQLNVGNTITTNDIYIRHEPTIISLGIILCTLLIVSMIFEIILTGTSMKRKHIAPLKPVGNISDILLKE